jgi:hypothetical protein
VSIDSFNSTQRPLDSVSVLHEPKGIWLPDVFLRYALLLGLKDLRENPWQLEVTFASFLDDPYTENMYGAKEVSKAINWFLKTEIPVLLDIQLASSPNMPCVTIGIQDSTEAESTLGDVHYQTNESAAAEWEPVTIKFNAEYDPVTGLVKPNKDVVVNEKMLFVDGNGQSHPVLSVKVDANDNEVFYIEKGLNTNFSNCVLKWATSKLSVQLESLNFRETYTIGSHVKGEPKDLLYLDAIVLYCLLRYKKTLLEGRGFERTTVSRTKILANQFAPVGTENIFSRFINLTGFCKNYWATQVSEKITKATFATPLDNDGLKISQVNFSSTKFKAPEDQLDPSWLASDGIGLKING